MNFLDRIARRHREFWNSGHWQAPLIEKLAGRRFAESCGVPVPALYWQGNDPNDIPFDQLPSRYVAKGTNGDSGYNVFVMVDGTNIKGDDVTEREIVERLCSSRNRDIESYMVEEFISPDGSSRGSLDYKVHAFNGHVGAIQVYDWDLIRSRFYRADWSLFDGPVLEGDTLDQVRDAPQALGQLVDFACRISAAYEIYVRIDFLLSPRGFVFGEMCATPGDVRFLTPPAVEYFTRLWDTHIGERI